MKKLKERIKKLTKKEKTFIIVLLAFSIVFLALSIYLYINDKNNAQNDLNNSQNENVLNTSWYELDNGNYHSSNMFRYGVINPTQNDVYNISDFVVGDTYSISGYYTNGFMYISSSGSSDSIMVGNGFNNAYTFEAVYDTYEIYFSTSNTNVRVMLNEGSPLSYEEYNAILYSEENYDAYYDSGYNMGHSDGLSEGYADGYNEGASTAQNEAYNEGYAKGASDTELKYFYFDNKTLKVYTAQTQNETLIGTEILHQDSYTNFYIDVTDLIEDYGQYETISFYRGDIDLNILSSDFYCNAIYPTSDIEGYFTIYYADGTIYDVPTYDLNREYHIYDGSITNPNKIITSISFAFHYDKLLTIELSCSPSSISYTNGYNKGYDKGYTSGKVDGNTIGYNSGYQVGYNEGASTDITTNGMKTLFNSILSYPINMLQSVFNFNFMGINIASFIMFLVSLGIVAFVLKKFLK